MSAATASDLERYMLELINQDRTRYGLDQLVLDQVLNASADAHSDWMLESNVFSHTGVGGSTPTERMRAEGFDLDGNWSTAENVAIQSERGAAGYTDDVYDLHVALMNSPGHRANLLDPDLELVGIGIDVGTFTFDSGTYTSVIVTQNFASTDGQTTPDPGSQISARQDETPDDTNDTSFQANAITGGNGDDRLLTLAGDDAFDGGAGRDTAVFTGPQDAYTLVFAPGGATIVDRRGSDGTDTLDGIETLQFADGSFDIDIRSGATGLSEADFAAIVELYIAYFDRAPAAKGLLYWATRLEDGMSLPQIAESFFVQPETQGTYAAYLDAGGNITDTSAFVTAVFNNVLGRDPTGPYWVNELDTNPAITPALFILAVLNGAKAVTGGAQDRAFLETKTDIGVYFAGIKGLSDYDDTVEVMEIYDGSADSVTAAVDRIDQLYAQAQDADDGAFLIELAGVIDDPFAGV